MNGNGLFLSYNLNANYNYLKMLFYTRIFLTVYVPVDLTRNGCIEG